MNVYLVTEGAFDADLLRLVFPPELSENLVFASGGGRSAMISLARTVLAAKRSPVVLVLDADTMNPRRLLSDKADLLDVLHMASASVPSEIVLIVPEIEALFFTDPELLVRALGGEIPKRVSYIAEAQPKRALNELMEGSARIDTRQQLLDALVGEDLRKLRAAEPIREISDFVASVSQSHLARMAS